MVGCGRSRAAGRGAEDDSWAAAQRSAGGGVSLFYPREDIRGATADVFFGFGGDVGLWPKALGLAHALSGEAALLGLAATKNDDWNIQQGAQGVDVGVPEVWPAFPLRRFIRQGEVARSRREVLAPRRVQKTLHRAADGDAEGAGAKGGASTGRPLSPTGRPLS